MLKLGNKTENSYLEASLLWTAGTRCGNTATKQRTVNLKLVYRRHHAHMLKHDNKQRIVRLKLVYRRYDAHDAKTRQQNRE